MQHPRRRNAIHKGEGTKGDRKPNLRDQENKKKKKKNTKKKKKKKSVMYETIALADLGELGGILPLSLNSRERGEGQPGKDHLTL